MSNDAFDRCWAFLQRPDIEGGAIISNRSDDPGGLTKWGISQRAYPAEDIRNLTEARARDFFRHDYWKVCRCDELPDAVAIVLADCAFNQGPGTAIRLLQQALHLKIDGVFGPVTLAAAGGTLDLNEFLSRRLLRYADGNPTDRHGWFLRILKLKDVIG